MIEYQVSGHHQQSHGPNHGDGGDDALSFLITVFLAHHPQVFLVDAPENGSFDLDPSFFKTEEVHFASIIRILFKKPPPSE